MKFQLLTAFLVSYLLLAFNLPVLAAVNPESTANNKFGVHILSADSKEASAAADLVNSNGGDWGYVTLLIESNNRDLNRWQAFFKELRHRHLIPIVRIATKPVDDHWEVPGSSEPQVWADFLDKLYWPTQNRYVVVYNEPNHGQEWGGTVDPATYAKILNSTIDALKQKSADFFVLNAGFDASSPEKPPNYLDEESFLKSMDQAVPGIFNKLDGWASHSYPNPGFSGSPTDSGRGSITTYRWELQLLKQLGVTKELPVFITETGWKHAEGLKPDNSLPDADQVAAYYKTAFQSVWADPQIVAVTPFILNYQQQPFDHFSFKKVTGEEQKNPILLTGQQVLGAQYPEFYPFYQTIAGLNKVAGQPAQESKAELVKGEIYKTLIAGQSYSISLTFKNIGQTIWQSYHVRLVPTQGGSELGLNPIAIIKSVEPGEEYTFVVALKTPQAGRYSSEFNLFNDDKEFSNNPFHFTSEVTTPVMLQIKTGLAWGKDPSGYYLLDMGGVNGDDIQSVLINHSGFSDPIEARNLLPGYNFDLTLTKPYYQPKTIHASVDTGTNTIDFGELQPDFFSALLNPIALWKMLPFSR